MLMMPKKKSIPPYLRKGDAVAIVSPSWAIDEDKIQQAVGLLESWGLKPEIGKNVLKRNGPFAGTDEERLSDLQEMTDNPEIKAVFCSRGGYGMIRIISQIDFSSLKRDPKWYIGFSDITVLHLWLSEVCGLVSIHGEMPLHYSMTDRSAGTFDSLHDLLFGGYKQISWEGEFINPAQISGEITGGNLSLMYSLMGTKAEPETKGKILFIEEVGEYYYHLDRMMFSLRLAGKLKDPAGIIVGGLTRMQDTVTPWGKSAEMTVADAVSAYNYPVFFGFPAGHINDNRAFYIGRRASVTTMGSKALLKYDQ
jgi:muramoyltetrapeptide carboxypeptidase